MNNLTTYGKLTACIFIAVLFCQTFSKFFIVADYYTNVASYEKKCVNKAKPVLKCHGKCQMMKKLQEEEKRNEDNPERRAENNNELISSFSSFLTVVTLPAIELITTGKKYTHAHGKPIDRYYGIFHPPRYL